MPYAEDIKQCNSIDDIIDYCHNALPEEYKGRPWTHPELNHGINLLASDVALTLLYVCIWRYACNQVSCRNDEFPI